MNSKHSNKQQQESKMSKVPMNKWGKDHWSKLFSDYFREVVGKLKVGVVGRCRAFNLTKGVRL
jgi:hypothetical protein